MGSQAPLQPLRPAPNTANTSSSAASDSHQAKVAILQCTLQGQHFLAEQLDSIEAQTYSSWRLYVSDDGSDDDTLLILYQYREKWGDERIMVRSGPAAGFAANFLSLTCAADIRAEYYAYADQDDVWEAEKLSRAIAWLESVPAAIPALYCSRTRLIDENGHELGLSPLHSRLPSFANALVHCIGGGNTMVFNEAACDLLRRAGEDASVVTHDWWAYLVVTGCGGKVFYDPYPTVRYRQHRNNLVGSNVIGLARVLRMRMMLKGVLRGWIDRNARALQRIRSRLTPGNRRILDEFCAARKRPLLPRLIGLKRSGIYHQTSPGKLALLVAALLNKL